METYRGRPDLTEVPGSLRRKISIYAELEHHPSHTFDDEEQEKFVETATRIKKQVCQHLYPVLLVFLQAYLFLDAATWCQFR